MADDHAVIPTVLDCIRIAAIVPALYTLASAIAASPLNAATGQTSGSSEFQRWRRSELCFAKDGSERYSQLLDRSVIDEMLKLAKVTKDDLVYDLGCGDGRVVVTAAKTYGARGVGIDIDPERIKEATANAAKAGVGDRVKFMQADLFETDLRPATVVTLYLLESLNLKLQPKLVSELKPGTRIVSHAFSMGPWTPDQELTVEGRRVYLWKIPPKTAGATGTGGVQR